MAWLEADHALIGGVGEGVVVVITIVASHGSAYIVGDAVLTVLDITAETLSVALRVQVT